MTSGVVTTGTGSVGHDGIALWSYDSGGGGGGGGDGIVATVGGVQMFVPLVGIQGGAGGARSREWLARTFWLYI